MARDVLVLPAGKGGMVKVEAAPPTARTPVPAVGVRVTRSWLVKTWFAVVAGVKLLTRRFPAAVMSTSGMSVPPSLIHSRIWSAGPETLKPQARWKFSPSPVYWMTLVPSV